MTDEDAKPRHVGGVFVSAVALKKPAALFVDAVALKEVDQI